MIYCEALLIWLFPNNNNVECRREIVSLRSGVIRNLVCYIHITDVPLTLRSWPVFRHFAVVQLLGLTGFALWLVSEKSGKTRWMLILLMLCGGSSRARDCVVCPTCEVKGARWLLFASCHAPTRPSCRHSPLIATLSGGKLCLDSTDTGCVTTCFDRSRLAISKDGSDKHKRWSELSILEPQVKRSRAAN